MLVNNKNITEMCIFADIFIPHIHGLLYKQLASMKSKSILTNGLLCSSIELGKPKQKLTIYV